jgi:hypothetical protein
MELKTAQRPHPLVPATSPRGRATIVIADSGDSAAVIALQLERPLSVGSRFSHHNVEWVITGCRPFSRALVAEPVEA